MGNSGCCDLTGVDFAKRRGEQVGLQLFHSLKRQRMKAPRKRPVVKLFSYTLKHTA
jgi:hypothetical protein